VEAKEKDAKQIKRGKRIKNQRESGAGKGRRSRWRTKLALDEGRSRGRARVNAVGGGGHFENKANKGPREYEFKPCARDEDTGR